MRKPLSSDIFALCWPARSSQESAQRRFHSLHVFALGTSCASSTGGACNACVVGVPEAALWIALSLREFTGDEPIS